MTWLRPKVSLAIEITNACNLQCSFCYMIRERRMKSEFISLDKFENILRIYRPFYLQITGGEATMHPNFIEILRTASRYVLKTKVSSNGILIENYINDFLTFSNPPDIGISLDAPNVLHDVIRNRKGLFRNILQTLKLLKAKNIPHTLAMTVFGKKDLPNLPEGNLHLVEDMILFCEKFHLFVNFQPYSPAKNETRIALGKKLLESKSKYIMNTIPYRKMLINGNWITCRYNWTNIAINSAGNRLPTMFQNCFLCSDCAQCYYSCVWEPSLITSRQLLQTAASIIRQGLYFKFL